MSYQPTPKLDSSTNVRPLNRYILHVKKNFYKHDYSLGEDVLYKREESYSIQWKNIALDIKDFILNPVATFPRVAYSLLAIPFILRHDFDGAAITAFAFGALTRDSATTSNNTATFDVIVGNNSNRILIMGFGHYQGGDNISGATYNSTSLTEVKAQAGLYGERAGLWGLVAPSTGTNSFAISGNDSWSGYGVLSIYDADQNLPSVTAGSSADSNHATSTLTTSADNSWVVAAMGSEPVPTMSTSSGVEDMKLQGASYQNAEMHHVLKSTAGSQEMWCSLSYGGRWNMASCEVKVASGVSTAVKDLLMGGIIPFAR